MTVSRFHLRWVLANVVGTLVGLGIFALIGHGITGPHDEKHPTGAEIAAHAVGFIVAGCTIAIALSTALRDRSTLVGWFVPAMGLVTTTTFLFGAYVLRPPADFLLTYAAVGALVELARHRPADNRARSALISAALFTLGSFIGMLGLSLVARIIGFPLGAAGEDLPHHVITMTSGGLFIGLAVGLVTSQRFASRFDRNAHRAATE